MATIAFLRAAPLARGFANTDFHFFTSLHSFCHNNNRQAISTNAVRNRTLPCFVIESW
jgi:hypothetical protein